MYPTVTFVGNGGCSTSALYDYLTVNNITVPTVERNHLALHLHQAQPSAGLMPPLYSIVYMDLQVLPTADFLFSMPIPTCKDRSMSDKRWHAVWADNHGFQQSQLDDTDIGVQLHHIWPQPCGLPRLRGPVEHHLDSCHRPKRRRARQPLLARR